MVKSKLRKLFLRVVFFYATIFPNSGLIEYQKSLNEMEDDGEIHLGI
jgi:hypothetical protein